MALSSSTIWEVQTGGSDTASGGAFDPSQTAGMFTDGAATVANTSAPVFTSASYNFVAGDAGAWLYIAAGTNWTAGWYKIASVASNAATLTATIGLAVLKAGGLSTATGCATTASPTGATWTIDYSQQAAAQFTYTDLASAGAGLTVSSAAFPFAKQQVGNCIVITGGTNFTAGRYVIASVAAGVATVVGAANITTGAGASGTGGQGGALASPGKAAGLVLAVNDVWIKSGTYTMTTTSTNVAAGIVNLTVGPASETNVMRWIGYQTTRFDFGTRPVLTTDQTSCTLFTVAVTGHVLVDNIEADGASKTSVRGFAVDNQYFPFFRRLVARNCTNTGIYYNPATPGLGYMLNCYVTTSSGASGAFFVSGPCRNCVAYANTTTGFVGNGSDQTYINCIAAGNTGASTDGFIPSNNGVHYINCVAYANGRQGFSFPQFSERNATAENCIAVGNGAYGFTAGTVADGVLIINCAGYNNTTANYNTTNIVRLENFVALTGDPFTNSAGGDFSLNNTAGAGASLRATGTPGAFPVIGTTGYMDVGAVQHNAVAGIAISPVGSSFINGVH